MKGLARDVTASRGLMIPVGAAVHWSISESYGSRVVGEGNTTLSSLWRMGSGVECAGKGKARELRGSLQLWVVAITQG